MASRAPSQSSPVPSNPHAIVMIGDETYDSWRHLHLFTGIRVQLTTGAMSEGVCTFFDPDFHFINKYTRSDGIPNLVMRFWLGFGQDLGTPLFKGLLARISRDDNSTTFRAYDMSFLMRREKRTGYNKGTDVEIMKKLVTRNEPLKLEISKNVKPLPIKTSMQQAQTDWEHLSELAEEAGLVLYTRDDTVFAQEAAKTADQPLLIYNFGQDSTILRGSDFNYKLPENQEGRPRRVEVRGRGRGDKRLSGVSGENERGTMNVQIKRGLRLRTKAEVTRRANAIKALEQERSFECSIRVVNKTVMITPDPLSGIFLPYFVRADVRDTIELQNVGLLFGGKYLIDTVTHDYSSRGLVTSYDLYKDIKAG